MATNNNKGLNKIEKSMIDPDFVGEVDQLNQQLADKAEKKQSVEWLNVKEHGAKGDGVTDDTDVIEALISTPNSKVLYFPAGTYLISRRISYGRTNVSMTIVGDGDNSIIKCVDNFGEYQYLFSLNVRSIRIENICFDINSTNNPRTSVDDGLTFPPTERLRIPFVLYYQRAIINKVTVKDSIGTNVFNCHFYGDGLNQDRYFEFTNNKILDTGLAAGPDLAYDHSSLVIVGNQNENITVKDNHFRGANKGNPVAFAAIELDSCNTDCSHNYVENYHYAFITTSWGMKNTLDNHTNVRIHHNSAFNCRKGVVVWGSQSQVNPDGPNSGMKFSGLFIHDNYFHINPDLFADKNYTGHYQSTSPPITMGIEFYDWTRKMRNVYVERNTIEFEPSTVVFDNLYRSYGIGGRSSLEVNEASDNIHIKDNTIINAPGAGIFLEYNKLSNIVITGNRLVEGGSGIKSVASNYCLRVSSSTANSSLSNVTVNRNTFVDSGATANYEKYIQVYSNQEVKNAVIKDNDYQIPNIGTKQVLNIGTRGVFTVIESVPNFASNVAISPDVRFTTDSRFVSLSNGDVYTFNTNGERVVRGKRSYFNPIGFNPSAAGSYIEKVPATVTDGVLHTGWIKVTTGATNSLGTDWQEVKSPV